MSMNSLLRLQQAGADQRHAREELRQGMQVARRHALNANVVCKWLRDPRFAPAPDAAVSLEGSFLPVEIVEDVPRLSGRSADAAREPGGTIEIEVAGGHRLRISGHYDPEALARLIRGLTA